MNSRGLANFAIGAGAGYLGAENQRRDRGRQDRIDQQNTEFHNARMRRETGLLEDADRLRVDNTALRTAAQPIAPVQDGAGGMLKSDDQDNRDVGLADNAGRTNGGLSQASYRVGQQSFASKGEADAAAARLNTPQQSALRLSDAQRKTGDVAGAHKTLSDERARAADQMLRDMGTGLAKGWAPFTEALSKSAADDTDYSHALNPATGKVDIKQTSRQTGASRVIGSYDDSDPGKLGAFKFLASTIAGKPEVAMAYLADKVKGDREDRKLDIKEEYHKGMLDAKGAALDARTAAFESKQTGQPSREERMRYTTLFTDAGRRAGEAQKSINTLTQGSGAMLFMNAVKTKPDGPEARQLAELQGSLKQHNEERSLYQGLLAAGSQSSGGRTNGPSNASEADMKRSISGDMGADPAAIGRELKHAQADLAKVTDPASRQQLNDYIKDLQGQQAGLVGLGDARTSAPAKQSYSHLWK